MTSNAHGFIRPLIWSIIRAEKVILHIVEHRRTVYEIWDKSVVRRTLKLTPERRRQERPGL